jgi:type VI protein secretion system component Hcp
MPIFMRFGGLVGNVQNAQTTGHMQWAQLNSFQWGATNPNNIGPGASTVPRPSWAPTVSELMVTKGTDLASPLLFQHHRLGAKLLVSIVFGKHPSQGPVFHTVNLTNARIASIWPCSDGRQSQEKIVIRFTEYNYNGIPNIPVPYHLFHL